MNTRALLGTTTGEFDSVRVRVPPFVGPHVEVASLVAGAGSPGPQGPAGNDGAAGADVTPGRVAEGIHEKKIAHARFVLTCLLSWHVAL